MSHFSNREWSRQYVDVPFLSRFAPAIELDVDCAADGVDFEDANIRAAQAILFRSRTKCAPSKEEQHSRPELKGTPRRLEAMTPSKREAASPSVNRIPSGKANAKFDATPVKTAINDSARTPCSTPSLSASKQRCDSLNLKNRT